MSAALELGQRWRSLKIGRTWGREYVITGFKQVGAWSDGRSLRMVSLTETRPVPDEIKGFMRHWEMEFPSPEDSVYTQFNGQRGGYELLTASEAPASPVAWMHKNGFCISDADKTKWPKLYTTCTIPLFALPAGQEKV